MPALTTTDPAAELEADAVAASRAAVRVHPAEGAGTPRAVLI